MQMIPVCLALTEGSGGDNCLVFACSHLFYVQELHVGEGGEVRRGRQREKIEREGGGRETERGEGRETEGGEGGRQRGKGEKESQEETQQRFHVQFRLREHSCHICSVWSRIEACPPSDRRECPHPSPPCSKDSHVHCNTTRECPTCKIKQTVT